MSSRSLDRKQVLLIGAVNSGKSSLFNSLLRQQRSIVSDAPGTTTDCVAKSIELPGVGAALLVDTPGLLDATPLGEQRMQATRQALAAADLILYFIDSPGAFAHPIVEEIRKRRLPLLPLSSKADQSRPWLTDDLRQEIKERFSHPLIEVSAKTGVGIDTLLRAIAKVLSVHDDAPDLLGNLCCSGDTVLLVMPQDSSAPQGRLILPQVQTIRALLDRGCHTLCTTPDRLAGSLAVLHHPPHLIITDSQVFAEVEAQTPLSTRLTSFSILMSAYKGDLARLLRGARHLVRLTSESRILIAEACTHAPDGEDIGTVKLPRLLRRRFGERLCIDHVSGRDFPADLTSYDLVIHCGACMFNRQHLLTRQAQADADDVPMTNYGLAIASLTGILDRVALP